MIRADLREATKKKQEKKFTTVVIYLQKWRTPPPPPSSQQFQLLSELENQRFLQLLRYEISLKSSFKQTDHEKFSSL